MKNLCLLDSDDGTVLKRIVLPEDISQTELDRINDALSDHDLYLAEDMIGVEILGSHNPQNIINAVLKIINKGS